MNRNELVFEKTFFDSPKKCGDYFLMQIGEVICINNSETEYHNQEYFKITYISKGKGLCIINEKTFDLSANICYISLPGETHTIISNSENHLHYFTITLSAEENSQGNSLIKKIIKHCTNTKNRIIPVNDIRNVFVSILNENKAPDLYSIRNTELLIEQCLIECNRSILGRKNTVSLEMSDEKLLSYNVISYIDQNLDTIFHVSDLEKAFYYSSSLLTKIFLEQTGFSVKSYIVNKKMDYAKRLLKKGVSVTDVSVKLGYSSIHAFSRAYKRYYNTTPTSSKSKTNIM